MQLQFKSIQTANRALEYSKRCPYYTWRTIYTFITTFTQREACLQTTSGDPYQKLITPTIINSSLVLCVIKAFY